MLGIKEWNLDSLMFKFVWSPFKWMGKKLQFLRSDISLAVLVSIGVVFLILVNIYPSWFQSWNNSIPVIFFTIALAVILFAFSSRQSSLRAWVYILAGHFFILSAVLVNAEYIRYTEIVYYVSGILIAFLLGYFCLQKIRSIDNDISLNHYHGYVYEQETTGLLFLFAAIGMLGFPITAAFIGIDVLFTYIHHEQVVQIILMALCFVFIELAAFRILLRIFFGPHKKLYHPVAFHSS